MSRGYAIILDGHHEHDYVKMASLLFKSLRFQADVQCAVLYNSQTIPLSRLKTTNLVDCSLIEMPWRSLSESSSWKVMDKWKVFHLTPYDETILLDADMYFPPYELNWWDLLATNDVWATTSVYSFDGKRISTSPYRDDVTRLGLPNVYSALFYFKRKSDLALELFEEYHRVMKDWDTITEPLRLKQRFPSGDLGLALAMARLNIQDQCTRPNVSLPGFVHLKPGLGDLPEDWVETIPLVRDKHELVIGGYRQTLPVHYVDKRLADVFGNYP